MSEDSPFDFSVLDQIGAPYRFFDAGEKIFLEDDAADAMYMVRSGRVDVITYGTVLENVRAGGIFGEMALIDDGRRSAAAMAAEPTEVVAIDKRAFLTIISNDPQFALRVMGLLANRLRRMNKEH
ncbi:MAG: cyclic nucleotide-binding domain-containing protein [Hyphomicrobium sp.]|uniref:cyclic nucleotide-binding domain-containing protein n=1 Tax=Hyphomicrobium sp. TaxID=82 RepID=UPI0035641FCF